MEDKYNAFGQFLKKKLKEEALENSDWAKPDAEVREALVQQISNTTVATTTAPAIGFAKMLGVAASIIVLTLGGYSFHLHQINAQLNNQINSQNAKINTQNAQLKSALESKTGLLENNTLTVIKKKHAKELAALLQEKVTFETLSKTINQQNETLKQQVTQQENTLLQLGKENQLLLEQKKLCYQNETANQKHLKNLNGLNKQLERQRSLQQKRITQLELLNNNWASTICLPTSDRKNRNSNLWIQPLAVKLASPFSENLVMRSKLKESISEMNNLAKRNRFEIGYTYTFSERDIWIQNSFENEDGFPNTYYGHASRSSPGFHGFRISFSPLNRFWIKTGLSHRAQFLTTLFKINGIYFKEGEINTPERAVRNELSLITRTEYTETTNSISFEFNRGELVVNDPMQILISDNQNLNYYRIPINFEYYYGRKRLQGTVLGGFRLTRINGTHLVLANVKTHGAEIKTTSERLSQPIKPKYFVDINAGLGLDYQLLQNLHGKANFSLHHKFIKNNIYSIIKSADFDLGLYYRF